MKRTTCAQCLRAEKACICSCVQRLSSRVDLLILQHPKEVHHIKGSARLLHLCWANSRLLVGDVFQEEQLNEALFLGGRRPVLLYPSDEERAHDLALMRCDAVAELEQCRLVLIDASWRDSRAMLGKNSLLHTLPRRALKQVPSSQYHIRRAHKADQLSSIEAAAYALFQLEKNTENLAHLMQAFEQFNAMQLAFGVHKLLRVSK
ncbi:MAG: DTW domain-containing protein [Undibacterium sp.]|nr:DTW domain-containing protein [Undibacterium sp.]